MQVPGCCRAAMRSSLGMPVPGTAFPLNPKDLLPGTAQTIRQDADGASLGMCLRKYKMHFAAIVEDWGS